MPKFLFLLAFLVFVADARSQSAAGSRYLALPLTASIVPRTPNLEVQDWHLPEQLEYSIMSGARPPRVIQGADHFLQLGPISSSDDSPVFNVLRRWSLEANAGVGYLFQNGWRLALTYRDGPEDPREMYCAARGICLLFRYGLGGKRHSSFR